MGTLVLWEPFFESRSTRAAFVIRLQGRLACLPIGPVF